MTDVMRRFGRLIRRHRKDASPQDKRPEPSDEVLQLAREICKEEGFQWGGSETKVTPRPPDGFHPLGRGAVASQEGWIEKARLKLQLGRAKKQT
jgi:hypothetical protein